MDAQRINPQEALDTLQPQAQIPVDTEKGFRCSEASRCISGPDIPEHYRRWMVDDFSAEIYTALHPFFGLRATSVYLHGIVGSRKTSLAAAILRQWRAMGLPSGGGYGYGEFVASGTFARQARDFETGPQAMASWRQTGIIVLDDVAGARSTPHLVEQLAHLICHRYDRNLPVVATSNLNLGELADALDARIASRFQDGIVLDLGDKDWRRTEGA